MDFHTKFWVDFVKQHLQVSNREIFVGYRLRGLQSRLQNFFFGEMIQHEIFSKGIIKGKLLDIGSGPISYFECFPSVEVVALDPCIDSCVELCPGIFKKGQVNNVKYISGTIDDITEDEFDIIWCTNVLDHIESYKHIFRKFPNLLSENGICIIQTDCRSTFNTCEGHEGVFSAKELLREIRALDFHIYYSLLTRGGHGGDSINLIFGKKKTLRDTCNKDFYEYFILMKRIRFRKYLPKFIYPLVKKIYFYFSKGRQNS